MKSKFNLISVALVLSISSVYAQDWAPAGEHIRTKWADEVSPDKVHPEYPRPQLIRAAGWASLNGLWDYAIVAKDADAPASYDGRILVPFCLESSLSGVGRSLAGDEALWYRTTFRLDPRWKRNVVLNFGAVDWQADVYVNGSYVGTHTGGYTAFSFDISSCLKKGKNAVQTLEVKVIDDTDSNFQPRGKQVSKPNSIWYTAVSGIWQSVWIEETGIAYISDYYAVPDVDGGKISVAVSTFSGSAEDQLEIGLYEGGVGYSAENDRLGACVATGTVAPGDTIVFDVPDARLWSPDSPYIYALSMKLSRKGKTIDEALGYTAMRKISVVEDALGRKRMALNNEPLFHFGPLDQGWWPDGLYTAPTDEALAYDIQKTKDMGFNMIRKHIKVEPARWFYHCDRLGILVWQDMPCFTDSRFGRWGTKGYDTGEDTRTSDECKANYYKEWGEIILQLKKYPCVVVWVPFNEAWAQFDTPAVVNFTRELDPTRLIDMASGGNWTVKGTDGKRATCGDILDVHHYPEPRVEFWDFDMVNVLGEYGGIGYPIEGHLWQNDKNWGYVKYRSSDDVMKEYTAFAKMLEQLVKFGCSAAVYTQTTDVEIEVNGLMTYDRIPKLDEAAVKAVNEAVIHTMDRMFRD